MAHFLLSLSHSIVLTFFNMYEYVLLMILYLTNFYIRIIYETSYELHTLFIYNVCNLRYLPVIYILVSEWGVISGRQ